MTYKDYDIEVREDPRGHWTAFIRRIDGKPISTAPYGPSDVSILPTKTHFKEQDAIEEAKRLIDGGGMK